MSIIITACLSAESALVATLVRCSRLATKEEVVITTVHAIVIVEVGEAELLCANVLDGALLQVTELLSLLIHTGLVITKVTLSGLRLVIVDNHRVCKA